MNNYCLNNLNKKENKRLIKKLYVKQNGKCFICEEIIDLKLPKNTIDIGFIIPLKLGGKEDLINFGLIHSSCNQNRRDVNMEVARMLKSLERIKHELQMEL